MTFLENLVFKKSLYKKIDAFLNLSKHFLVVNTSVYSKHSNNSKVNVLSSVIKSIAKLVIFK